MTIATITSTKQTVESAPAPARPLAPRVNLSGERIHFAGDGPNRAQIGPRLQLGASLVIRR